MIVYKDCITGDELFSDCFPVKELLDVAYEVEGKFITGQSQNYDIGANPSAEESAETYDNPVISGIDIVIAHRLVEIVIDKRYFKGYMKEYSSRLLQMVTQQQCDRVAKFKKDMDTVVHDLVKKFKDLRFFVGESNDMSGGLMILDFRQNSDESETPIFIVFKDGLEPTKC